MDEGSWACPNSHPCPDSDFDGEHSKGPCRLGVAVQGGRGTWRLGWGQGDHAWRGAGHGFAVGTEMHEYDDPSPANKISSSPI